MIQTFCFEMGRWASTVGWTRVPPIHLALNLEPGQVHRDPWLKAPFVINLTYRRLSHRLVGELSNTVWEGCASTEVGRSSCTGGLSAPREVVYSLSSMAPWAWAKALGRCAIA